MKLVSPAKPQFTLPAAANVPSTSLQDYSILLYGRKKIGKTSLAAQFPGTLILCAEPGAKSLRVHQADIRDWKTWVMAVDAVSKDKQFPNVAIDTIDLIYQYCFAHVCKEAGVDHPTEMNDRGMTWNKVRSTFRASVDKLMKCGKGVIFISHDTEKEIELRDGGKLDRVQPTMSKQAMEEIEALVDIIAHYDYSGRDRVLNIDGSDELVAGSRLEENFIRKGGKPRTPGDRVVRIPMGGSAGEGFEAFMRAYRNEQETNGLPPPVKLTLKKK